MERWKSEAINDLRMLDARRMAAESLRLRRMEIEADMTSVSSVCCDRTPVHGGGNRQEAMLAGAIDRMDKIDRKREAMLQLVEQTEKVLDVLPERQRVILNVMYVHRKRDPVRQLEQALYLSPAAVYREKDAALEAFAMLMGYK